MSRHWRIPPLWPGATGVVIAGGPSVTLEQIRRIGIARLEGRCRVLAVNDAVFPAWWADWLHGCDPMWWNWHRLSVTKFTGIKTTMVEGLPEGWNVKLLRNECGEGGQLGGFAAAPDALAPGGNGGYQAIQCLAKAGCTRILGIGFDMKVGDDGRGHWFGEHPGAYRSDYAGTMLPWFETLIDPLKARGIEFVNCTPGSALTCFPTGDLDEELPIRAVG